MASMKGVIFIRNPRNMWTVEESTGCHPYCFFHQLTVNKRNDLLLYLLYGVLK